MYYPEANVLIPRRIDPQSATPVFKSVMARMKVGDEGILKPVD